MCLRKYDVCIEWTSQIRSLFQLVATRTFLPGSFLNEIKHLHSRSLSVGQFKREVGVSIGNAVSPCFTSGDGWTEGEAQGGARVAPVGARQGTVGLGCWWLPGGPPQQTPLLGKAGAGWPMGVWGREEVWGVLGDAGIIHLFIIYLFSM